VVVPPSLVLRAIPLSCARRATRPYPRRPYKRVNGVYLLIKDGRVIYVGASSDVQTRLNAHLRYARRPHAHFDHVLFLPVPTAQHFIYESVLIRALRPPLNRKVWNIDPDIEAAVLADLGL
jgi:GIY-YIG catalytic domain-containing protein